METRSRWWPWLAAVGFAAACGDSPSSPSDLASPLEVIAETPHHVFYAAAGDTVDSEWQERYHAWATEELGVSPERKIRFYKYRDRMHIRQLTGNVGNAFADPSTFSIHTIWSTDNHEVVHLYASLWGSPPALFSEGFAVAHQVDPDRADRVPRWSSVPVHTWASRFRREDRLIPIGELLETAGFRRFDDNVTYPESGSFIRYLIDRHGLDKMRSLFRDSSPSQSEAATRASFRAVYGIDVDTAEREWHASLDP